MKKPQGKPTVAKVVSGPAKGHEAELEIVAALARIARDHDLSELVVERAGLHVRVARGSQLAHTTYVAAPAPHSALASPLVAAAAKAVESAEAPGTVKSPMVGTAYLRASPESKAFIEVGSSVKEGDKVLLVEAMKTFNEIVAPRSGLVTHIFVEDGTPVEFDQPLLAIA